MSRGGDRFESISPTLHWSENHAVQDIGVQEEKFIVGGEPVHPVCVVCVDLSLVKKSTSALPNLSKICATTSGCRHHSSGCTQCYVDQQMNYSL